MDSTCCLICLNKKYEIVLCLECDFYVSREPGDTWQTYYRKICKHINKHRKNGGIDALSQPERLRIFSFLELHVGAPLAVTKPTTDLGLHSRDALENSREALYMKESHIVDAVLCGFDECTFLVADAKNRLNRLKAHSKNTHNGMPIQQVSVKAQEVRLNTYFLLGYSNEALNLQSYNDGMVFMTQQVPEQFPSSEEADLHLPMLEILENSRKQTDETYVGKWEKFFRTEISESLLLELYSDGTSEIKREALVLLIDAWLVGCEEVWFKSIEPNYSLQQLLMKHFEDAPLFQKAFRIQAVRRKGRYLLVGFLSFCLNWRAVKAGGRIPEIWSNLLSIECASQLDRLIVELKADICNPKTFDQFLDLIFEWKSPLKDANVLTHVVSAYLIGWVFRDGLIHAPKHLRNASQGAYAFENVIRLHSAAQYVETGEPDVLDRVKLKVTTPEGTFINAIEFAHQVRKACDLSKQVVSKGTGV